MLSCSIDLYGKLIDHLLDCIQRKQDNSATRTYINAVAAIRCGAVGIAGLGRVGESGQVLVSSIISHPGRGYLDLECLVRDLKCYTVVTKHNQAATFVLL